MRSSFFKRMMLEGNLSTLLSFLLGAGSVFLKTAVCKSLKNLVHTQNFSCIRNQKVVANLILACDNFLFFRLYFIGKKL